MKMGSLSFEIRIDLPACWGTEGVLRFGNHE